MSDKKDITTYDIFCGCEYGYTSEESSDGDWCRTEDVLASLKAKDELIRELVNMGRYRRCPTCNGTGIMDLGRPDGGRANYRETADCTTCAKWGALITKANEHTNN